MRSGFKNVARVTVYALSSSKNYDMVRYIGQTSRLLSVRLSQHLSTGSDTPVARWIRGELAKGRSIHIQPLEKNAVHAKAEVRWIALFKASGAKLLNCNAGGGGGQAGIKPAETIVQTKMPLSPAAAWPFPVRPVVKKRLHSDPSAHRPTASRASPTSGGS